MTQERARGVRVPAPFSLGLRAATSAAARGVVPTWLDDRTSLVLALSGANNSQPSLAGATKIVAFTVIITDE
jgi:hypothetical protein